MPCAQQKIVDLVSASELLKALNTLQNMSVEHADGDVSFN